MTNLLFFFFLLGIFPEGLSPKPLLIAYSSHKHPRRAPRASFTVHLPQLILIIKVVSGADASGQKGPGFSSSPMGGGGGQGVFRFRRCRPGIVPLSLPLIPL